jgi:hypothetical protein
VHKNQTGVQKMEHIDIVESMKENRRIIEEVITSGLFSYEPESSHHFARCSYCQLQATVLDYEGFRNLHDAQSKDREKLRYEFELCDGCFAKVYGD